MLVCDSALLVQTCFQGELGLSFMLLETHLFHFHAATDMSFIRNASFVIWT